MTHQLHAYDYVNRPYDAVLATLLADPVAVFRRATTAASEHPVLHAKAGPLEVAAEVDVEVRAIEDVRSPDDKPAKRLVLEWKAVSNPGLFPIMHATLTIYPLTSSETQLDFAGTYEPPLGVVGGAIDAVAMHRIASTSVAGFVRDVASYLRPAA